MPERVRAIVARMRELIGDRRNAKRRRVRLPLVVSLVSRPGLNGLRPQSIGGHTVDLSAQGLSFVVPRIRIEDHYLAGESQRLRLAISVKPEPIELEVVAVRYEKAESGTENGYLIGCVIKQVSEAERLRYDSLVENDSSEDSSE